ncbi:MAG: zinc dependent phospholipase C family protein [Clostridiales bacterium]|nr:zinc dependent phospholipase C family protein [Clostridiales bacterium]
MGTWIVHLRIADYFINKLSGLDASEFAAGSVAPDCGYGKKDSFGSFTPPPSVTHWTPTGKKVNCRYKDFYSTYLKDCSDMKAYSFYLGYYIHLLTDVVWSSQIYLPTHIKFKAEYDKNPDFLLTIKKDWNDLDFRYLTEHPNFKAFALLAAKDEVRRYLPYYEPDQLSVQCRYIVDFYRCGIKTAHPYRKYFYLTPEEQNSFISDVTGVIEMDLIKKGVLRPLLCAV